VRARIEVEPDDVVTRGAFDLEPQLRGPVLGERVEHAGDLARDPGPHDHEVDAREHRSVKRR
jgi:hypothetical protein